MVEAKRMSKLPGTYAQTPDKSTTTYGFRMSPNQFAFARDLNKGLISGTGESLREANNGTVRSLAERGFVHANARGRLVLTEAGKQAVNTYLFLPRPSRTAAADLTDYVTIMLGLQNTRTKRERRLHVVKPTAKRARAASNGAG
jgi:hypothetical protein